ncbi:MAG: cupin domain-containing protein [Thermodesulfobacteriota bacterium]
MKIMTYQKVQPTCFDSEQVKGVQGRILIGKDDGAPNFCMRLFQVETGGYTPRHRHAWEHEVFVHGGSGAVLRDGEWVPVQAGSTVYVAPDEDHQFKNTGEGPLLFVCVIPAYAPEL